MNLRTSIAIGMTVTAAAVLTTGLAGCGGTPHTSVSATVDEPPSPTPSASASTQAECEARPDASGDILVRVTTNGQPAVTQQLGGSWSWDTRTHHCDTPVQSVIATASGNAGSCTQVAFVATNPGYQLTVSPAPPLKKVLADKGPAC